MSDRRRTSAAEEADATAAVEDDVALRAADGRVPGRRGMATRQRLLACTEGMLRASSYRDLKVVDIAREAGTSPATFYQYFPDVESAVLALAEDMAEQRGRFSSIVRDTRWRGRNGFAGAQALTAEFFDFWEEYRPVLRVVDFATEEGDRRFRTLRTKLLNDLTNALSEVISAMKLDGRHPPELEPTAAAAVLVAMLANVAGHRYGLEFWGIRSDDARTAMARIIYWTVTGKKP